MKSALALLLLLQSDPDWDAYKARVEKHRESIRDNLTKLVREGPKRALDITNPAEKKKFLADVAQAKKRLKTLNAEAIEAPLQQGASMEFRSSFS